MGQTPMARFGRPEELVGAALLLVSRTAGSFHHWRRVLCGRRIHGDEVVRVVSVQSGGSKLAERWWAEKIGRGTAVPSFCHSSFCQGVFSAYFWATRFSSLGAERLLRKAKSFWRSVEGSMTNSLAAALCLTAVGLNRFGQRRGAARREGTAPESATPQSGGVRHCRRVIGGTAANTSTGAL